MKKRILSLLLVICLLTGAMPVTALAADEDDDLAYTSAGFFKWLYEEKGDTDARNAWKLLTTGKYGSTDITDEKDGDFYASTKLGSEDDATSLENLQATIQFLEECNTLRKSDDNRKNLKDLKVSSLLMAMAEIDVNWSSSAIAHAAVFYVGENLAWGYSDPFDGWYTKEKAVYDSGGSGETGHYTNIIDSSYVATGFAMSTGGGAYGGITHGQVFHYSSSYAVYTVDEYAELLEEYVATLPEKEVLYTITVPATTGGTVTADPSGELAAGTTVELTVSPYSGYVLESLLVNGETLTAKNGVYSFEMPEADVTVTAVFTVQAAEKADSGSASGSGSSGTAGTVGGFHDVSASAWYAEPVTWAVEQGITSGTTSTTFSPDDTCTWAQVITFLYRAAGSPSVTGVKNPFTDISSSDYYYDAVLWAYDNGIAEGQTAASFGPDTVCTREQIVTYLYRYAGQPETASAQNPFTDLQADDNLDAILWAVEAGVTTGTSDTTFDPDGACTRAQVMTFLYRAVEAGASGASGQDNSAAAEADAEEPVPESTATGSVTASGTCGENLTWTLDSLGTLTVSGSGAMTDWNATSTERLYYSIYNGVADYNSYPAPWSEYTGMIQSVVIESGVTTIGSCAFASCTSLRSVSIPNTVTSIEKYAFHECTGLQSITIPGSVTLIGRRAFRSCTALASVTLNSGLQTVESCAFYDCDSLTSITIPASVTYIDMWAFGFYNDWGNPYRLDGFMIYGTAGSTAQSYATSYRLDFTAVA